MKIKKPVFPCNYCGLEIFDEAELSTWTGGKDEGVYHTICSRAKELGIKPKTKTFQVQVIQKLNETAPTVVVNNIKRSIF